MTRHWREPDPIAVSPSLIAAVGGSQLVARTLARRGIDSPDSAAAFLDPDRYIPADPFDLPDMDRAVEHLRRAITDRDTICVWGDFDVDGQTASALLAQALRQEGAAVQVHIPDRLTEGHGIQIPALAKLIDSGVRLILTCDTGIAAHEAVDYANERGVEVIVTDHHHLADTLPKALANVNPQRLPPDHPLRDLPGVGVAYELIKALSGGDQPHLLDLVALGIVADVAVQRGDTRYLLQRGLQTLRAALRPGLAALADTAGLDPTLIGEQHIGFVIAPRLNAAGRLDSAMLGVDLLLAKNLDAARTVALKLESLNAQRKLLCDQIEASAEAQIERDRSLLDQGVLVLSHPDWHTGVVGIVANRLVERYDVPVILLAAPPGAEARGSARSVDGVDITEALAANAPLLIGFGGHTMAAGLRLRPEAIGRLRRALDKTVRAARGEVAPGELVIDADVTIPEITLDLVEQLERLAPFGAGNPPVVLALRGLTLKGHTVMGRDQAHRSLILEDVDGGTLRAVWWNSASQPLPDADTRFDLACVVRASDYRGQRQVEVEYVDTKPSLGVGAVPVSTRIEVIDHRGSPDPLAALKALTGVQVWRESGDTIEGRTRLELERGEALAIWTIPPDRATLSAAIARVKPATVHLFAVDPPVVEIEPFLRRLLGLAKYAIQQRQGEANLPTLAAAMASTERAVTQGLDVLASLGALKWDEDTDGVLRLALGDSQPVPSETGKRQSLDALLAEMRAFRSFFRRTDGTALVNP